MICARCLSRLVRPSRTAGQAFNTSALTGTRIARSQCFSQQTNRSSSVTAPASASAQSAAASAPSASQPFTIPAGISSSDGGDGQGGLESTRVLSSVPAGTPLRGLDIYKGREAPVAMEDNAYPEWLWTVLDEGKPAGDIGGVSGTLSKKAAKKAARKAAKKAAKLGQFVQEEVIPINEQTIDLPVGDIMEASVARQELTKAMRAKRRASIKESNFLKTMR